ncbi:MAG: hypothetical protein PHN56_07340 [Candidatus Nanoarchaeia archaeon]|nr:hypothetical protein [Candidatus Nanoarchaeia archaeon]
MSKDYSQLVIILLSIFLFLFFYFAGMQAGYNHKCKVEFNNRIILYCPNNVVLEEDYSMQYCPTDNNLYCPNYLVLGGD